LPIRVAAAAELARSHQTRPRRRGVVASQGPWSSRFGTERSCLVVIDAASGEVVDGPISGLRYSSIAWIDEGAFYYVRGANVWFHRVSSTTADDRLVLPGATSGAVLPDVRLYHGRWLVAGHSYGSGQRRDL
jgi:prolyl oligopeptidase